jgi:hypothetical protein
MSNQLNNTIKSGRKKTVLGNVEDNLKLNFNEMTLNNIVDICQAKIKIYKSGKKMPLTQEAIAVKNLLNSKDKFSKEILDRLIRPNPIYRNEITQIS